MSFIVPFDGSELAEAALIRATEFSDVRDERVVAISVVPRSAEYAREKGWLGPNEGFDLEGVVKTLHTGVMMVAPEADFEHVVVGRTASGGTIAGEIRDRAKREGASVVFLGSENAGHVVTPVGEVGASVAAEEEYDVHIVRHPMPSAVEERKRANRRRTQPSVDPARKP